MRLGARSSSAHSRIECSPVSAASEGDFRGMRNHSELLKKYNVPGPRYTSYPTVPYWERNPSADEWITSIDQALTDGESRGIGAALYIHIPFCESLCTYCG